ncbi:MAG: hypothetical protein P8X62_10960 [Flavobacteriaceae bacterium]
MIFKQRKNKKFSYKPKFQENNTLDEDNSFQTKWEELKNSRKRKSSILLSPVVLVAFLIGLIILMYVLGRYE